MNTPSSPEPEKESIVFFDMSPQLEEELLRRAKEKGTDPAAEAARILEKHAREIDAGPDEAL